MTDIRVPPHDLEAERTVLGAVLLRPSVFEDLSERVAEGDFYREPHRAVWRCMAAVAARNDAIDVQSVAFELTHRGEVGHWREGVLAGVASLLDATPSVVGVGNVAARVRRLAVVRRLMYAAQGIAERAYEERPVDDAELAAFSDAAEAELLAASVGAERSSSLVSVGAVVQDVAGAVDRASRGGEPAGYATGLAGIDRIIGGLDPGALVVLAARPGVGKTSLALQIALHVARTSGRAALFSSLEMSRRELVFRLLSSEARVDARGLKAGNLQRHEWDTLVATCSTLTDVPLMIDDRGAQTINDVRSGARRVKHLRGGLALVVVDYLQIMRPGERHERRDLAIGEMTGGAKALAKELGVPVVLLSQLNRQVESRSGDDRRPRLSDLRDSGCIEQDADVVMFLHQEKPTGDGPVIETVPAELVVAKNRNGPRGSASLVFFGAQTRFGDADYRQTEAPRSSGNGSHAPTWHERHERGDL